MESRVEWEGSVWGVGAGNERRSERRIAKKGGSKKRGREELLVNLKLSLSGSVEAQ